MKIWAFGLAVILAATPAFCAHTDDVIGPWQTNGESSSLDIFKCGEKLCGKVVWLKHPNYVSSKDGPVGMPKVDLKNPDPKLRTRPILGLQVIEGLTPTGDNRWEHGSCYDPESGNSYQCKMRLEKPDKLEVRGFIGFSLLGRTYVLTRKEDHPSSQVNSSQP
jgi:uncharacterized protein (DUF2147 family)